MSLDEKSKAPPRPPPSGTTDKGDDEAPELRGARPGALRRGWPGSAFGNLRTGTRLTGAFLAMALIVVGVAALGYRSIESVNAGMSTMYADRLLPAQQLGDTNDAQLKIGTDLYRYVLEPENRVKLEQGLAAQLQRAAEAMEQYEQTYLVPEEERGLASFKLAWAGYVQAVEEGVRRADAGRTREVLVSLGEGGAVFVAQQELNRILSRLIEVQVEIGIALKQDGDRTFRRASAFMIGAGLVGTLLAVALGALIGRSVTAPLVTITGVATEMAEGRLDPSALAGLESRSEVGVLARAFTRMANELRHTLEGLRRSHDELERRVEERTAELRRSNEQLEQEVAERRSAEAVLSIRTQELARSNAELKQFAYVASHDLQEPLRMVASYLQLLDLRHREKLDGEAREFMGFALDGAKRMQTLIVDLLAYSRVGTAGRPLAPTACEEVLQAAMSNLQVAIRESGARITHDPLPTVLGDATQLVQLFQNLLGNAIKFRRDEPPLIEVRAELRDDFWRLSVQDNGIGIEPRYFERIFVVFQRLHGRKAYAGTGIGLAICKRIVERHGGTIEVASEPGKGSTFSFTIPGMVAASPGMPGSHPMERSS